MMNAEPQTHGNEAAPPSNANQNKQGTVKTWELVLVATVVVLMIAGAAVGIVLGTKGDPQPANTGIDPETGKVVSTFRLPTPSSPTIFGGGDEEEYEFIRTELASKQAFGNVLAKLPGSLSALPTTSSDPIVQAALWLTSQDQTNAKEFALTRFALASLYYAMNGPSWTDSKDWLSDANHCDWYGVECCPELMASTSCTYTDFHKFIQLDLYRNNLVGTLPETIGLFPDLQSIFFNENAIEGKLPTHLGELGKLHRLYMQHNKFSGQIPSAADLDKSGLIDTMYLHGNNFVGNFTADWCKEACNVCNTKGLAEFGLDCDKVHCDGRCCLAWENCFYRAQLSTD